MNPGPDDGRPEPFLWPPVQPRQPSPPPSFPPSSPSTTPTSPAVPWPLPVPPPRGLDPTARVLAGVHGPVSLWVGSLEEALIGRVCHPPLESLVRADWKCESSWESCPRCATSTGVYEADMDGCSACRDRRLRWHRAVRLGQYEGVLREQILLLKYSRWVPSGRVLGRLLGEVLRARLEGAGFDPSRAVLIPVPMTTRRRMARGVDHTAELAKGASRVLGAETLAILGRRHGPSQASVPLSKRRSNVKGTITLRTPRLGMGLQRLQRVLDGASAIVMVDDVRTTGATLTEAWRVLERSGWIPGLVAGRGGVSGKIAAGASGGVGVAETDPPSGGGKAGSGAGLFGSGVSRWVATVAVVDEP